MRLTRELVRIDARLFDCIDAIEFARSDRLPPLGVGQVEGYFGRFGLGNRGTTSGRSCDRGGVKVVGEAASGALGGAKEAGQPVDVLGPEKAERKPFSLEEDRSRGLLDSALAERRPRVRRVSDARAFTDARAFKEEDVDVCRR